MHGFSRKLVWLKYSNSNRAETECKYFLNKASSQATPLKVRGGLGTKNRLILKYVISLRISYHSGHAGKISSQREN